VSCGHWVTGKGSSSVAVTAGAEVEFQVLNTRTGASTALEHCTAFVDDLFFFFFFFCDELRFVTQFSFSPSLDRPHLIVIAVCS
jgi:hypothetical protein